MTILTDLLSKKTKLSLTGLGYVGLPIAIAFAKKIDVIGFDLNQAKIDLYRQGIDPTHEVGDQAVKDSSMQFTSDPADLKAASFHIVAVPTPVHADHTPDLRPVQGASRLIGQNLQKGSIVVFESTVYPGVTEEICVPILEAESGLTCGVDFKVGYSPERINPGDKKHTLENIIKVVSGMDEASLQEIADVYSLVVEAGVYRAESIKVAEAAKVIENSQRDINIAFMNELSIIFHEMGIDTRAVLAAAKTKWNFLDFVPGLVGGHCIGVDPYYLTYKAEQLGYHSQIILSGRKINDQMGKYVVENLVKKLIKFDIPLKTARIAILGLTFKENVPDIRNTKVTDIYEELVEYGLQPLVFDPVADSDEVLHEYGFSLAKMVDICDMDALILAVGHHEFINLSEAQIRHFFKSKDETPRLLFDLKGLLSKTDYEKAGYQYWRL